MQIVINIPEVYYEALRKTDEIINSQQSGKTLMSVIYNAVGKGIPLPERHGRLIDADAFIEQESCCGYIEDMDIDYFKRKTPTIIEANK